MNTTNPNEGHPLRTALVLIAAPVTSTVAFLMFIIAARAFHAGSASADYAALAVSIGLGMIFIWRAPVQMSSRVMLCVVFAGLMIVWLFLFGVGFICSVYGDCL